MNKRKLTAIFAAAAVAAGLFAVTAPLAASAAEETAPYTQNFDDAEAALADFDTTDRFGTDNQIDFKISGGTLHTETTDKATFGDVVAWTLKKQFKNFKMEVDLQWKGDNGTSTDAVRFGNQVVAIHLRTYNGANTWRNRFEPNTDSGSIGGGFLYQLDKGNTPPRQMMALKNDGNFEIQEKLDAGRHFDGGVLHATIIVRDSVAAFYANGQLVNTCADLRAEAGYITFEVSGGEVIIDNLTITPGDFEIGYAAPAEPGSANALNDQAEIEEDFSFQYVESSANNTIRDVVFGDFWTINDGVLTRKNGVEKLQNGTDHTAVMTSQYKVKYFDASVEVLYGNTTDRSSVNLWPVLAYGTQKKGSYFIQESGNGLFVQADGVVTSWSGDSNMPGGGLKTLQKIPNWQPNSWHTLRVRVDGNGYQYYVDGVLYMARTYERGYDSGHEGYVSFQSVNNTSSFRNFRITNLNAAGEQIDMPHGTITGVTIDGDEAITMQVGDFKKLTATVTGTDNFDDSVNWSVDSGCATISSRGGLCAVKEGTVVVTAASAQDPTKKATLTVTISGKASMTYTEDFDDNTAEGWERHDGSAAGSAEHTNWTVSDGKVRGTSDGFDYKSRYMLGNRVFGNFVLEADVKYNEVVDVNNPNGGFGLIYVRSQNMDKGYEDSTYEGGIAFGLQWRSEGDSGNRCYFLVTAGNGGFERQISFVGIDDWVNENGVNRLKAIVDTDNIMFYVNGNHLEQADVELTDQVGMSGFVGFSVAKTDVEFDNLSIVDLVEPTGISIAEDKIEMKPGDDHQFIAVLEPENATNSSMIWESSDEDVAFVNDTGFVVAVGEGECVIKVSSKTNPELNDSVTVVVKADSGEIDPDESSSDESSKGENSDDSGSKADSESSNGAVESDGRTDDPQNPATGVPAPLYSAAVLLCGAAAVWATRKKRVNR